MPLPAVVFILGCANPGPPKPPALYLPEPAKDLAVERVGNHVVLTWETSARTTEGQIVQGPISAEVCRDDHPKPPPAAATFPLPPDPCRVVHEVTVTPGTAATPTRLVDELPAGFTKGTPGLLEYRVTLLNSKGRSAGPSAPAYAVSGSAPAAAGSITVTPQRGGALIVWGTTNLLPAAPMQVSRTLLAISTGPVSQQQKHSKKSDAQVSSPLDPSSAPTLQQVTLTPDRAGKPDTGGMVDHGIHDGDKVQYVAQRVLAVKLTPPPALVTGKKGRLTETKPVEQFFEVKSEASPAVTFTFLDVIPPAAPTGLAVVTSGGLGAPSSIDLSWEANAELDVAGYNVYRASGDLRYKRVNVQLAGGPEFRDTTAEKGKTYLYRVTAVDQRQHESSPSAAISAELR